MRVVVTVKTRARENKVVRVDEGHYRVFVMAIPSGGAANEAVIELLADEFKVGKSRVRILMGKTYREKLVEIS